MSERLLRECIRFLIEQTNSGTPAAWSTAARSGAANARLLTTTAADFDDVNFQKQPDDMHPHYRIKSATLQDANSGTVSQKLKDAMATLTDTPTAQLAVKVHPPGEGRLSVSDSFNTYGITIPGRRTRPTRRKQTVYFVVSGKGQRQGGYDYEDHIVAAIRSGAYSLEDLLKGRKPELPAYVGTDTAKTDAYIDPTGMSFVGIDPNDPLAGQTFSPHEMTPEKIGIELKAKLPKFGQPTLRYTFGADAPWEPSLTSRSPDTANLSAQALNKAKNKADVDAWMMKIKAAWDKKYPKDLMTTFDGIKPFSDYQKLRGKKRFKFSQSSPDVEVPPDLFIKYYQKKGAQYIQIKGKGLYHLGTDLLGLGTTSFGDALKSTTGKISVEIMNSSGAKLRATGDITGLKDMGKSNVDLDDYDDMENLREKFTKYAKSGLHTSGGRYAPGMTTPRTEEELRAVIRKVLDKNMPASELSF